MVSNTATLAWRFAGLRARAAPSLRFSSRPSILHRHSAIYQPKALRYASDTASEATEAVKEVPKKAGRSIKRTVLGTSLILAGLVGYVYVTDTRASIHRYVVVPLVRWLYPDAEDAHHIGVDSLKTLYKFSLHPRERGNQDGDGVLATEVFGYTINNPVGVSAGLDKNAEIPDPLFAIGAAVVEVGGTTPLPQEGNPRPRVFRLVSQKAMINRYGLNSKGADHMAAVLEKRVRDFAYAYGFGMHDEGEQRVLDGEAGVPPGSLQPGRLLAVQVAKNKVTPDSDIEAIKRDYVYCVDRLAKYADILVVNVSSPNTPGLRDLQATAPLTAILKAVVGAAQSAERKTKPFVMVKVSPDEDSDEQISGICDAVWNSGVDGVIVGNTTNRRPQAQGFALPPKEQSTLKETGGYSGPLMFNQTAALVARYRALLDAPPLPATDTAKLDGESGTAVEAAAPASRGPRKVIFASGGITNGRDAQAVLDAGASVAMMYTGIVFGGVGTVTRVKQELREEKEKEKRQ
ncbi:dihydroorotate dehydrogenase 2 [Aspergillus clavatus NRRL 1]|uniref:Dihydroorotate dehydrogenase (quinone), mitochondrial n=1 Tax=Aspergillus clavatus (strain ATCC 1007 / CBS 513.65 / DSM 816 / NCTC 3887 / NRRL 1 / QM 1276 / 107) TaxID=344612 RepID=A1C6E6_ASPCL|nr:dihydroorotate reductase PyrE, putative [Aspergillus clavatus NRRL 1]EAW13967.1 dihydroorotate reductase PyrE, putative [Aspergillus clavatus NRRL 1]